MVRTFRQLPNTGTPDESYDKEVVSTYGRIIDALGLSLPKNRLQFIKNDGQVITTTKGDFTAGTMNSNNVTWSGLGTVMTSTVTFDGQVWQISGVNFNSSVTIKSSSRCIFSNCRFASTVSVESGGVVTFQNCLFHTSGYCNNAGVPANVAIYGQKTSSTLHTNCTIVFEA